MGEGPVGSPSRKGAQGTPQLLQGVFLWGVAVDSTFLLGASVLAALSALLQCRYAEFCSVDTSRGGCPPRQCQAAGGSLEQWVPVISQGQPTGLPPQLLADLDVPLPLRMA